MDLLVNGLVFCYDQVWVMGRFVCNIPENLAVGNGLVISGYEIIDIDASEVVDNSLFWDVFRSISVSMSHILLMLSMLRLKLSIQVYISYCI